MDIVNLLHTKGNSEASWPVAWYRLHLLVDKSSYRGDFTQLNHINLRSTTFMVETFCILLLKMCTGGTPNTLSRRLAEP